MEKSELLSLLEAGSVRRLGYEHAHAHGVHSLVLREGPPMVRLYFADGSHVLWRNELYLRGESLCAFGSEVSVAVHPHRTAIRLTPIFGDVCNYIFEVRAKGESVAEGGDYVALARYRYRSRILHGEGEGRFDYEGGAALRSTDRRVLREETTLPADALHTVYVPRWELAAWLVEESAESDPDYEPVCYTNAVLERFDFSAHYRPLSERVERKILAWCTSELRGDRK